MGATTRDRPAGHVLKPGDQAQQRGLAATRRPHEDNEGAVLDVQVRILDDADRSERLADSLKGDQAIMGQITLQGVRKSFGPVSIIRGADLDIADGSFVVFVGPSGCGKTTLLRLIAGLEDVTGGKILIDGKNVVDVPPAKRGLSMVFQSYALYPHMSVRGNIAFGLKMAGLPRADINRKVEAAAATLNLTPYLERKPRDLSGGQRQRVAIGRAIVREPKAFLFDEPLSNLDAALRVQMRMEVTKLQKQLGTTAVYVTHNQVEAMTMA